MIDYVIEAWRTNLSLFLGNLWESIFFWRSLSLLLLTIGVLGSLFWNHIKDWLLRPECIAHDRDIFKSSDDIMTEQNLIEVLDQLETDNSYEADSMLRINGFLRYFKEEGNQYLFNTLRQAAQRLISSLNSLRDFTGAHFFEFPERPVGVERRFCLYPELKHGRPEKTQIYRKRAEELYRHVEIARADYKKYRYLIKRFLKL